MSRRSDTLAIIVSLHSGGACSTRTSRRRLAWTRCSGRRPALQLDDLEQPLPHRVLVAHLESRGALERDDVRLLDHFRDRHASAQCRRQARLGEASQVAPVALQEFDDRS
jgi:hypothetical protein